MIEKVEPTNGDVPKKASDRDQARSRSAAADGCGRDLQDALAPGSPSPAEHPEGQRGEIKRPNRQFAGNRGH